MNSNNKSGTFNNLNNHCVTTIDTLDYPKLNTKQYQFCDPFPHNLQQRGEFTKFHYKPSQSV